MKTISITAINLVITSVQVTKNSMGPQANTTDKPYQLIVQGTFPELDNMNYNGYFQITEAEATTGSQITLAETLVKVKLGIK